MKILALVTDAFGSHGGIAQYNRDLLTALAGQEQVESVTVLPRNGNSCEAPENIHQLDAIKNKWLYALSALTQTWRLRPDVLFCGHLNQLTLTWCVAKLSGASLWLQLHGIDAWDRPKGMAAMAANLAEKANLVTCVSRYTRRRFLSWANIQQDRVKILPNTVSARAAKSHACQVKEKLSISGRKVILTVGRLWSSEQYKGHDRIINCLPKLLKEEPDLCYLVAGDGDDQERLEQLAVTKGVSEQVVFLGKVPDEQLSDLYAMADLFAMPSTGEGFGIVFLEAMTAGMPALGLDRDGSVDPLQDGNLGYIASEENLCETIRGALNSEVPSDLSARVLETFGKKQFQKHVKALLRTELLQVVN